MSENVAAQIWLVPIGSVLAALIFAGTAILLGPKPITRAFIIDRLLRYFFLIPLGLMGLWGFVGHVFFPAESAAAIGWAPSPFQYEVGVANLGIGLGSLYAAFARFQARVAMAIVALCFLGGAGIGHIRDISEAGNFAPGNAGPILITDFLTPLIVVLLLVLAWLKPQPKSPTTLALEVELETARRAMREYRVALDKFHKEKRNAI